MELAVRDAIDCRALATRSRLLPGLVLLATAIPTDVKCPAAFPTGHLDYIERFATSYGIQEHHLSLCDWVVLFDASNRVVDLTFLPADQADLTLFATDLLTPSERQLLGL